MDATAFIKELQDHGYPQPWPSQRELSFYSAPVLEKTAGQLIKANTRPTDPRVYIIRSLDNEQEKFNRTPNKQYVCDGVDVEDEEPKKLRVAVGVDIGDDVVSTPTIAEQFASWTGKTWNPRVLAEKAGRSPSKVYKDIRDGVLFAIIRNGKKRIPSPLAKIYIEKNRA